MNGIVGRRRNPRLTDLITTVDAWEGAVTDADIGALAVEYGDTEFMVRHLFEYWDDRAAAWEKRGNDEQAS